MRQDSGIEDIRTFLESDLKDVINVLKEQNVFEVMLNPYECQDGTIEGHLWYDSAEFGMRRYFKERRENLYDYELPELGDLVLIKVLEDGTLLNYCILHTDKLFYESLKLAICYTLKEDNEGNLYLEEIEYYRLLEFANYIKAGHYAYKKPFDKKDNISNIIENINNIYLRQLDVSFSLQVVEATQELIEQMKAPQYVVTKEILKISLIHAEQMIGLMASVNEKKAHKYEPIVEVKIPFYGHRFTGILPPVSKFPFFTIRKHSVIVKSLDDYVKDGVMPQHAADILKKWVKERYNILVAGSVASGKTTLLNCLLRVAGNETPMDRVGIIEDTPEIQCMIENSYAIATTDNVSLPKLLRTAFRLSSNRLVVGELRGAEAYVFLKALTGGFSGCLATIHADGAMHALHRFEQCMSESNEVEKINKAQIASGINGVVSIQRVTLRKIVDGMPQTQIKRRVTALRAITGFDPNYSLYEDSWVYKDPETFAISNDGVIVDNKNDFESLKKRKKEA